LAWRHRTLHFTCLRSGDNGMDGMPARPRFFDDARWLLAVGVPRRQNMVSYLFFIFEKRVVPNALF